MAGLENPDRVTQVENVEIYESLVRQKGNLAKVSEELGLRRSNLKARIDKEPDLVALLDDIRQSLLDTAEQNVFSAVESNDQAASQFVLRTIGKDRGYTTGVAGDKGAPIEVVLREFVPKADTG